MPLPPLVEPGPPLTRDQVQRYSRHLLLDQLGATGQRRLAAARVAVIGAGGLGSPILTYLAAAGVGTIGVIDDDVVEMSNLQRQTVHRMADLGRPKTESASAFVATLNPTVQVVEHGERLVAANAARILGGYHLVLDGSDTFATRYLVNDACTLLGLPWVWGSVLRFAGQLSVFWAGHGPTLRDIYPQPPAAGTVPSCSEAGVLGVVCGVVGAAMATEAVKLICGIGEPLLGRLLTYDALAASYRSIPVRPDPDREPVTAVVDDPSGADPAASASSASREVTVEELTALLDAEQPAVLVDVREDTERASGVLPGAVPIRLAEILSGVAVEQLRVLASSPRPVVLYCAAGARSLRAVRTLADEGIATASLRGGLLGWPSAPLTGDPAG